MNYPETVNILGTTYRIAYCDQALDVDCDHKLQMWGQINFWTRTIRIYAHERQAADIWHTLLHEVLHGIQEALHMQKVSLEDDNVIDVLAITLSDVLLRNEWLREQAM